MNPRYESFHPLWKSFAASLARIARMSSVGLPCRAGLESRFVRKGLDEFASRSTPPGILAASLILSAPLLWAAEPPISDQEILEHSPVGLSLDEIGRYAEEIDPASIKWGRFAVFDPASARRLRDARKSPEQKAAEDLALLAISDPDAFRRTKEAAERNKKPKSPEEEAVERRISKEREEAFQAMLDPVRGALETRNEQSPQQRRRQAIARQAILSPREFNARVERHKSAALKQKEADALLAFTQPRLFRERRLREIKTGSREPQKDAGAERGNSPRAQSPVKGNRPEKGAARGGGR